MASKYHIVKKNGQWVAVIEYECVLRGENNRKGFKATFEITEKLLLSLLVYPFQVMNDMRFPFAFSMLPSLKHIE